MTVESSTEASPTRRILQLDHTPLDRPTSKGWKEQHIVASTLLLSFIFQGSSMVAMPTGQLNEVSAGNRPRTPLRDALSGVTVSGPTYLWACA